MAWCYEIRGLDNRLVEIRSGFATEKEAREAGERSKRMIDCICYPNQETLSFVIKEDGIALSLPREAPSALDDKPGLPPEARHEANLKYPWQQAVLDAFLEPHAENVPGKINMAERAISQRLLESDPFQLDERIALGEALLALRRLMREQGGANEESSRERKGVA